LFSSLRILILSITALLVFLLVVKPMIRRLTTPVAPMARRTALPAPGTPGAPQLTHAPGEAQPQPQQAGSPAQLGAPKKESMIDISQIAARCANPRSAKWATS